MSRGAAIAVAISSAWGLLAHARPTQACSPQPPDWISFAEVLPRQGAREVAIDAPLVIRRNLFPARELAISKFDLPQTAQGWADLLKVEITNEGTGQPIPAAAGALGWNGSLMTFRPNPPMPPNTRVKVVARMTNLYVRPDNASGETEAILEFTTGTATLSPLTSSATFTASLERYIAPVIEPGACAPIESTTATEPAVRTRIRLPRVTGGFADTAYFVRTFITRDVAYDFVADPGQRATIASDYRYVAAGESPEVVLRLPDDSTLTTVCHASEYEDASGKKLRTTPVCLPALRAVPVAAPAEAEPATGCNVGGNNDSAAPLAVVIGWASFISYLILRRARRRRDL